MATSSTRKTLEPPPIKLETGLRTVMGGILLIAGPVLIMLLVMAGRFMGLRSATARDHAQLARHIAAGDGFETSTIRPLSLSFNQNGPHHPDLLNAPLHPLALAAAFRLAGISDKVVAGLGLALWVLTVWLTFVIACAWFGSGVAGLAAFFYGCNVATIVLSADGLPQPLMAITVLLAVWLVIPRLDDDAHGKLPLRRVGWAGACCGLAYLTSYTLAAVAVTLGVYLLLTQRRRIHALGIFAAGFVAVTLPWFVRNGVVAGSPIFSLHWYGIAHGTRTYPGDAVWRTLEAPVPPVAYAFQHPLQIAHKLATGISLFRSGGLRELEPVVLFIFGAVVLVASVNRRWRALIAVTLISVALAVVASCLLVPETELLVVWAPLMCIVAAAGAADWIRENIGKLAVPGLVEVFPEFNTDPLPGMKRRFPMGGVTIGGRWTRLLAHAVVLGLVSWPLLLFMFDTRMKPGPGLDATVAKLSGAVPPGQAVLTDQPSLVAWAMNRRAVLVCRQEEDWEALEKIVGRFGAVYVTPVLVQARTFENVEWWTWLLSSRGIYRGLAVVEQPVPYGLLRTSRNVEQPGTDGAASAMTLARLRDEVKADPKSVESRQRLAEELLQQYRLREAHEQFQEMTRLDSQNADALLGQWQTLAILNDATYELPLVRRALRANLRDPAAAQMLAETTRIVEQALARRPRDGWLLLHAAMCQARRQRPDKVEEYVKTIAAIASPGIPARLLLAKLSLEHGLIDEATVQIEQLLIKHPNSPVGHEALARVRVQQGRWTEALEEFKKAQRFRPNWATVYQEAGATHLRLKQYDAAVEQFQTAVKLLPRSADAQVALAGALTLRGDRPQAIEVYEQLLQQQPHHPLALHNLADVYAKNKEYERARDLARRAVEADPHNGVIRHTLGWIEHLTGQNTEALADLQEAARLSPENAIVQYRLGIVLHDAGRSDEAGEALRHALARGLPPSEKTEAEALLAKP